MLRSLCATKRSLQIIPETMCAIVVAVLVKIDGALGRHRVDAKSHIMCKYVRVVWTNYSDIFGLTALWPALVGGNSRRNRLCGVWSTNYGFAPSLRCLSHR